MSPDVANEMENLKMLRNACFLKDHWWNNVQISQGRYWRRYPFFGAYEIAQLEGYV